MSEKIGLFYGSSTCYTEMAAEKIREHIGVERVDIFNIADEPISQCQAYNHLIFGIPTWDYGELQEDWEHIWPDLDTLALQGKKAGLFGLGDQVGYPEWFLDAMGYLAEKIEIQGALLVGRWPNEGYTFDKSQALTDNQQHFVGLALDDENQGDQSAQRIAQWCAQVLNEFGLSR
ncbi:MAG: flavodoxin FldB [Cellvibrionaceae bacterium]|nr:flavodoxin FldB [Cellvibrionaceae bacterium]